MKNPKVVTLILFLLLLSPVSYAAITNYLILEDIEPYRLFTGVPGRVFSGPPSKYSQTSTGGILDAAGHFSEDDVSYEASYKEPNSKWPFVKVEVTQHSGSDSDKWLVHELDAEFRNYYGIPDMSYTIKLIDGNTLFAFGSGGWDYRWLSGYKVIMIEYNDLDMVKPQPLEVVKAYLAKHPSTLPALKLVDVRSPEMKTIWIKDEMERRLWLSDKWFLQIQVGKVESSETLQTIVKSMNVFLDYREKYYNISAKSEKELLLGYLEARNGTAIKNKLTEYKTWWGVNKTKAINLP